MIDGRHWNWWGNHVTIGAANPADSALLRNPNLLKFNHILATSPGLSYLFSGAFIGPTYKHQELMKED